MIVSDRGLSTEPAGRPCRPGATGSIGREPGSVGSVAPGPGSIGGSTGSVGPAPKSIGSDVWGRSVVWRRSAPPGALYKCREEDGAVLPSGRVPNPCPQADPACEPSSGRCRAPPWGGPCTRSRGPTPFGGTFRELHVRAYHAPPRVLHRKVWSYGWVTHVLTHAW